MIKKAELTQPKVLDAIGVTSAGGPTAGMGTSAGQPDIETDWEEHYSHHRIDLNRPEWGIGQGTKLIGGTLAQGFDGAINDVRFYDRTLSDSEVQALCCNEVIRVETGDSSAAVQWLRKIRGERPAPPNRRGVPDLAASTSPRNKDPPPIRRVHPLAWWGINMTVGALCPGDRDALMVRAPRDAGNEVQSATDTSGIVSRTEMCENREHHSCI